MRSSGNKKQRGLVASGAVTGVLMLAFLLAAAAGNATNTKPSQYAPADDLEHQVKTLMDQLHKDLATKDEYEDKQKGRVERDANTVAVLALVLGNHDQANGLRGSAAAVIQAATTLAEESGDYAAARAALAKLDAALDMSSSGKVKWSAVGNIEQLMLQVPILNTSLRRAVNGRRFAKSRDKASALVACLAAIAQVSIFDDTYCSDDEDQAKWISFCVAMRDAAAGCNKAVHGNSPDGAKEALTKMMLSCDNCHAVFRD